MKRYLTLMLALLLFIFIPTNTYAVGTQINYDATFDTNRNAGDVYVLVDAQKVSYLTRLSYLEGKKRIGFVLRNSDNKIREGYLEFSTSRFYIGSTSVAVNGLSAVFDDALVSMVDNSDYPYQLPGNKNAKEYNNTLSIEAKLLRNECGILLALNRLAKNPQVPVDVPLIPVYDVDLSSGLPANVGKYSLAEIVMMYYQFFGNDFDVSNRILGTKVYSPTAISNLAAVDISKEVKSLSGTVTASTKKRLFKQLFKTVAERFQVTPKAVSAEEAVKLPNVNERVVALWKHIDRQNSAIQTNVRENNERIISERQEQGAKDSELKVDESLTHSVSTSNIETWYNIAWGLNANISPETKMSGVGEEFKSAQGLLNYQFSDEKFKKEWMYKALDILAVAYMHGPNIEEVKKWDPDQRVLREVWDYATEKNGNSDVSIQTSAFIEYKSRLDDTIGKNLEDKYSRLNTFYERMYLLYSYMQFEESPEYRDWVSNFYGASTSATSAAIKFENYYDKGFLDLSNGSGLASNPVRFQVGTGGLLPAESHGYILATVLEVGYYRDALLPIANDEIQNNTIKENESLLVGLKEVKRAVDEFKIPLMVDLWESESEATANLPFKSLKALYEELEKLPGQDNQSATDATVPLERAKPMSDFFTYEADKEVLSDLYLKGIAYSAAMVPMKTNVYSKDWINYLEEDFVNKFHKQWGFNRKALYIDTSSAAAQTYFVTGTSGQKRVVTLKDLVNAKGDVVLYLDDNFYNADLLGFDTINSAAATARVASPSDVSLPGGQNWWAYTASAVETVYNTNTENVLKTGDASNYSKNFFLMMNDLQEAHTYYPQATVDNPGNSDTAVLNSGQINYYLRADEPGSEIYSPLQAYAVVSAVYRDADLYNRSNSGIKRAPVFIASERAGKARNATDEAKASIFNYAIMRNLKDTMAVSYTGNIDINSPLYMDIYGNILTESGYVVIPAASNPTLMDSRDFYTGNWSAGLFSIYGNGYRIKDDSNHSFNSVLSSTFQPVKGVWLPLSRTLGNSYVVDVSRLSTSAKDTMDVLYTQTYIDLKNTNGSAAPYFNFEKYMNICMEVLRGAPIENIDKETEGLSTDSRLDRAGITAAAKLEELNKTLNSAGENTTISLPNLAFIPMFNVVALLIFKVLLLGVLIVNMVIVYVDTVTGELTLHTLWKCLMAIVVTLTIVMIVPALFDISYYQSNRTLLQDESIYISMLNLEKDESGVEIGVTELTEPQINTNLYVQLDDISMPWWTLLRNVMFADTLKTLESIYQEHAQTQSFIFDHNDVEIKHNGVYMNVSDIYSSTSVDINTQFSPEATRRELVQTARNKTSTFSYYSPYYVFLDALIRNVNYFNANPWGNKALAENTQGWYSYTTKMQKGGRVKSMGLIVPYFTSERFLNEKDRDILGLYHIYSGLYTTPVEEDEALNSLFNTNMTNIQASNWYPRGIANEALIKRIEYMNAQARDFVANNKDMLGKVSDETFLKAMALDMSIKHNTVFGNRYASYIEINNLSNDDLLRLSFTKRDNVLTNSTLTYPRFVYEVGGTPAVYGAAVLSMVMWVSSVVKPLFVIFTFLLIFVSVFVFKVCMRKKDATYLGYFITVMLLCLTNVLYSLILKFTLWLPSLGISAFPCVLIQIALQIGYLLLLSTVVFNATKEWRDLAATKYALKAEDIKIGFMSKIQRRSRGEGGYQYDGSNRRTTAKENKEYFNALLNERLRRRRLRNE